MVRFRFSKDYDYVVRANERANTSSEVAYKKGQEVDIPDAHAAAAEAAGAGERVEEAKTDAKRGRSS